MNSPELPTMDNITTFGITCWPGKSANAGVFETRPGTPALAIYLDPISIVITIPPVTGGNREMAEFCRQLATAANGLAADLDPEREPGVSE